MRETQVQSLGWEDLLEKEMATHSNILAWKIPWTEKPGRLQSMGLQRVRHNWATSLSLSQWKEKNKVTIVHVNTQEYTLVFNNGLAGSKGMGRNPIKPLFTEMVETPLGASYTQVNFGSKDL